METYNHIIGSLYFCMASTVAISLDLWKQDVNLLFQINLRGDKFAFYMQINLLCNSKFTWCFHKANL